MNTAALPGVQRANRAYGVILAVITLDAVGIGLVLPIIPRLLREVGHTGDLGWRYGVFLSLYALMQFIFSPVLGALSDRFGRRPVLLCSLLGTVTDYLFMAMAPTLWLLFVGRAIAGITGASMAVATAYVADVTPEGQRARWFGRASACFGVGFIAGPALGGMLGDIGVRLPFVVAAGLNAITLVAAFVLLRESRAKSKESEPFDFGVFNPLTPLRWAASFPALTPMLCVYVMLGLASTVAGTVWVLYGEDKFGWNSTLIGISLAGYGLCHALSQVFAVGPLSERWGERTALIIGIAVNALAYLLIAFVTQGWIALALLPLFSIGGIAAPALQSLMSARAGEAHQGRLQGVVASLAGLASIFGPLLVSLMYYEYRTTFTGSVWIVGSVLYLLCLPLLMAKTFKR